MSAPRFGDPMGASRPFTRGVAVAVAVGGPQVAKAHVRDFEPGSTPQLRNREANEGHVPTWDPKCFEEMFELEYGFVWRSLRRLGVLEHSVDDAAQEVFMIAARRFADIRSGAERSFLFGTALRVASDRRRALARCPEQGVEPEVLSAIPLDAPGPDQILEHKQARVMLDLALDGLDLESRAAFVLFEIEEMTTVEIAACLCIPKGTVASRLRRAREHVERFVVRHKAAAARQKR